jgi:hypothetical protein
LIEISWQPQAHSSTFLMCLLLMVLGGSLRFASLLPICREEANKTSHFWSVPMMIGGSGSIRDFIYPNLPRSHSQTIRTRSQKKETSGSGSIFLFVPLGEYRTIQFVSLFVFFVCSSVCR